MTGPLTRRIAAAKPKPEPKPPKPAWLDRLTAKEMRQA